MNEKNNLNVYQNTLFNENYKNFLQNLINSKMSKIKEILGVGTCGKHYQVSELSCRLYKNLECAIQFRIIEKPSFKFPGDSPQGSNLSYFNSFKYPLVDSEKLFLLDAKKVCSFFDLCIAIKGKTNLVICGLDDQGIIIRPEICEPEMRFLIPSHLIFDEKGNINVHDFLHKSKEMFDQQGEEFLIFNRHIRGMIEAPEFSEELLNQSKTLSQGPV